MTTEHDATERFVAWQRDFNGVGESRTRRIRAQLQDLGTFVGGSPEDATASDFAGWLEAMGAGGLHPNSVRQYGGMVRPFFKWARREGLIPADRALALAEVPNPRGSTNESTPKPYTRKEIARLWVELDREYPAAPKYVERFVAGRSRYPRVWRHAARLQHEALIHLCLHGGLRREEVFRLDVEDIDPDNAYIVVKGAAKGTGSREFREREVPMTVELRRSQSEWLAMRRILGVTHERPWIVLNPRANPNGVIPATLFAPLSYSRFREVMLNLGSGWSFHRLRHTYATELLRNGMPIENLKELLGHSRIQQTLAYAKIVPQDNERHMRRVEEGFTAALARSAA